MRALAKHWSRIAVTLIPVVLALLHAAGVARIGVLQRLDDILYDARLRATMPRTLDERIVIVDIDEKSLAEHGRWPWSRNKLGQLVDGLFEQHQIALLGFDVVFAEADESSGLARLNELARTELKDQPGFSERLRQLQPALDKRPVVLGYYLTSDRDGRTNGVLPAPVISREALRGRTIHATSWNGYGSNIENPESIARAMFRALAGSPGLAPGFSNVDERVATLVPFRGPGGVAGGSFRYVSAADILTQRVPPGSLKGKIILLGTTVPGLLDLRVTPVGETYPGVEMHANVISGFLDGKVLLKPDYALGYDVVMLTFAGLILSFGLPLLSASRAVILSAAVLSMLVGLNFWLYLSYGLVLPLASALTMALAAFALNMSYGYFVESRSKRELAHLFGTYVPPDRYSMQAAMQMADAVRGINEDHRARGLPEIGIGMGLNTGTMCVGDMGSNIRRSYTVIGDAVNLGSRLEGLSKIYGVDIVVNETTRRLNELKTWAIFLNAYRAQKWDQAEVLLINLMRMNAKKYLYQLYGERVASMRFLPFDPEWDGATNFETK
jgi:adenylate cyclase